MTHHRLNLVKKHLVCSCGWFKNYETWPKMRELLIDVEKHQEGTRTTEHEVATINVFDNPQWRNWNSRCVVRCSCGWLKKSVRNVQEMIPPCDPAHFNR